MRRPPRLTYVYIDPKHAAQVLEAQVWLREREATRTERRREVVEDTKRRR